MIFFISSLIFVAGFLSSVCTKKFQTVLPKGNVILGFYALITGIISVVNFLIMTGFAPTFNLRICIFSLLYAAVCKWGYVVTFNSLKYNGVFMSSVFTRCGSLIMPMIISFVLFGESQSLATVVSAICIIVASVLPSVGKEEKKAVKKEGLIYAGLGMFISAYSTMSMKLLVSLEGADKILSYYLLTNVFIALISMIKVLFSVSQYGIGEIKNFHPKYYGLVFVIATISNLSGFMSQWMFAHIEVIMGTVIINALGVFSTMLVSAYFKEKLTKRHYASAVLSFAAAILPVIVIYKIHPI